MQLPRHPQVPANQLDCFFFFFFLENKNTEITFLLKFYMFCLFTLFVTYNLVRKGGKHAGHILLLVWTIASLGLRFLSHLHSFSSVKWPLVHSTLIVRMSCSAFTRTVRHETQFSNKFTTLHVDWAQLTSIATTLTQSCRQYVILTQEGPALVCTWFSFRDLSLWVQLLPAWGITF